MHHAYARHRIRIRPHTRNDISLPKVALVCLTLFANLGGMAQTGNPAYDAWAKSSGPKPGMYEYKMTTEMSGIPGMGTMKMPLKTFKKCITQKDVDEGRQIMADNKSGFKCTMTSFSAKGNIAQYAQSCAGPDMKMTSVGTIEHKGDVQIHNSKTSMQSKEMTTQSSNLMEIRRLGDCK